jgi:transcriptional regulator with XRE-family HTH domain
MGSSQLGERIKMLRERQNLFLRHVATALKMDTAQLSKIENGQRVLNRKHIPALARILKANADELMTLWLADQIYEVVNVGDFAQAKEALNIVSNNLKK